MEETLTLTRVIENINYVYGEKLVKALLLFVVVEIVALFVIGRLKPALLKYVRVVVLAVAVITSFTFLSRSKIQEGYKKIELNNTTCAFQEVYDDHGFKNRSMADVKIYNQHYFEKYGAFPEKEEEFDLSVVCEESAPRNLMQIIACTIVLLMGFLCSRCAFKGKRDLLSVALAAPVGAAVLVVMTLFYIVFHIPYHWITVLIFCGCLFGYTIWYSIKNNMKLKVQTYIGLVISVLLIICSTMLKFYRMAGDARWQVLYAKDLVTYHHLMEEFYQVATYGFLGTSLHAFGILFGADFLYAYFSILGLSSIAVAVILTNIILEDKIQKMQVAITMIFGLSLLFTNFDYLYYLAWMLSNCAIGVCFVIILGLTLLCLKKGDDISFVVSLVSFVVITTRIEGVCYAVLLLSIPFNREGALKKTNLVVGMEIIVWQIIQFVLSTGVGQDGWTPTKGIGLLLVGGLLLSEPYLDRVRWIKKVMRHYTALYTLLLLGIIGLGFVYDNSMALDNCNVFLSHFSVSKNSNSLAFWGFILAILPLAVNTCIKETDNLLATVVCYILLIFGISIFRTGNPLHTGTSDSFRRVLCQIMPLAVWFVAYYAGKNNEC